jgi:uncharacterized protein (DUF1330 family)
VRKKSDSVFGPSCRARAFTRDAFQPHDPSGNNNRDRVSAFSVTPWLTLDLQRVADWRIVLFPPRCSGGPSRQREIKTMTAYLIADVKVTDNGWVPEYAASVHDIVHKHGGKYLARSGNVKTLEGKPLDTTLIALLQFPSAEAAEAFVNDPQYVPYAAARKGGSESRIQLIDDTDLAGTIPYLPKG